MKVFNVGASGFHVTGVMLVAARTAERAVELANEESDKKWHLHYYVNNAIELHSITHNNTDNGSAIEHVSVVREWGNPELPSGYDATKWSGVDYHG